MTVQANSAGPVQPEGLALTLIIVTIFLGTFTFALVSLRIWFRLWLRRSGVEPNAWGWDDILAGIGLVGFVAACCATVLGAFYGLGTKDSGLNNAQIALAGEYVFVFQLTEALFTIFVKASIGMFLLRLTPQRSYRVPIYFVIFATVVGCVVPGVAVLVLCHPINAMWDPEAGTCGDYSIITKLSYAVSAITVATDWTCAMIPCIIVRGLNIPQGQKLPIMSILSLGIMASAASIGRIPYLHAYDSVDDRLYGEGNIVLWCIIEGSLAFLAGSLPPLRKAPQMMMERLRMRAHRSGSEPLNLYEGEEFPLESNSHKSSLP